MSLKQAAVLGLPLLLGACATSVDISVPSNKVAAFEHCLKDPGATYKRPASGIAASPAVADWTNRILAASSYAPGSARPLSTSAPASFRNLYEDLAANRSQVSADALEGNDAHLAAVNRVRALLSSSKVQDGINRFYNGLSAASDENEIDFSVRDVGDYVRAIDKSTTLDDWSAYANSSIYSLGLSLKSGSAEDIRANFDNTVMAIYIAEYFKAYFRNGQFLKGSVSLPTVEAAFPTLATLPDPLKTQLDDWIKSLQDQLVFGKIGDVGLVTRGGDMVQIPGISVAFDPAAAKVSATKLDYAAIGADLVRVLLEAVFDAHDRIPAVSKATGISQIATHAGMEGFALVDFGKIKEWNQDYGKITDAQFGKIQEFANSLDAAAASGTGQLIRGLGPASLNNDAIAKVIESAVGTTVHKVGEKLGWCWYATAAGSRANPNAAIGVLTQPRWGGLPPEVVADISKATDQPTAWQASRQIRVKVKYDWRL
jgi:hypothetical protein